MKTLTSLALLLVCLGVAAPARAVEPVTKPPAPEKSPAAETVTLTGMLGCGKCSFHEAKACENVLKVKDAGGGKDDSYLLADNDVSRANHEKVCGPASPATVTGTVSKAHGKTILTATAIKFD